ncbi:MAG TPA: GntR family transcriptional regulator [Longimicrobium sp.]|jgi:DNA-binding GntR family transcriptional regulator|nr:GntR family transcriptional regulator [Longimicrobium sp.]
MTSASTTRSRDGSSQAYVQLRELIVLGRLAPGGRVIESDLAERLGTSRTPVRSALHRLQGEGYVIARRGGRRTQLTVAPLTREDGRELFWIVGELEAMAAHWVARGDGGDRRQVSEAMQRTNHELLHASNADAPDPARLFDLHTRFHQTYVDACGGPRVQAMHAVVKPQAERYRRLYSTALGGHIHASLAEHEAIVRGIADGDPEAAERAVKTNWRNAADRLVRVVERMGERGSW